MSKLSMECSRFTVYSGRTEIGVCIRGNGVWVFMQNQSPFLQGCGVTAVDAVTSVMGDPCDVLPMFTLHSDVVKLPEVHS